MPTTYEAISSQTLGSAQTSITFSSISSAYTDLYLITRGGMNTSTGYGLSVRINGDTGNNYGYVRMYGAGSTISTDKAATYQWAASLVPASNNMAGNFALTFFDYTNTSARKVMHFQTYSRGWDGGGSTGMVSCDAAVWRNTAAITSIEISPEFAAQWLTGTIATLYGIKRA